MSARLHEFATFLRQAAAAKGLSQTEVAKRCNLTPQSVSRWFSARALPKEEYLPELASILGMDIGDLVAKLPRRTLLVPLPPNPRPAPAFTRDNPDSVPLPPDPPAPVLHAVGTPPPQAKDFTPLPDTEPLTAAMLDLYQERVLFMQAQHRFSKALRSVEADLLTDLASLIEDSGGEVQTFNGTSDPLALLARSNDLAVIYPDCPTWFGLDLRFSPPSLTGVARAGLSLRTPPDQSVELLLVYPYVLDEDKTVHYLMIPTRLLSSPAHRGLLTPLRLMFRGSDPVAEEPPELKVYKDVFDLRELLPTQE